MNVKIAGKTPLSTDLVGRITSGKLECMRCGYHYTPSPGGGCPVCGCKVSCDIGIRDPDNPINV